MKFNYRLRTVFTCIRTKLTSRVYLTRFTEVIAIIYTKRNVSPELANRFHPRALHNNLSASRLEWHHNQRNIIYRSVCDGETEELGVLQFDLCVNVKFCINKERHFESFFFLLMLRSHSVFEDHILGRTRTYDMIMITYRTSSCNASARFA